MVLRRSPTDVGDDFLKRQKELEKELTKASKTFDDELRKVEKDLVKRAAKPFKAVKVEPDPYLEGLDERAPSRYGDDYGSLGATVTRKSSFHSDVPEAMSIEAKKLSRTMQLAVASMIKDLVLSTDSLARCLNLDVITSAIGPEKKNDPQVWRVELLIKQIERTDKAYNKTALADRLIADAVKSIQEDYLDDAPLKPSKNNSKKRWPKLRPLKG